MELLPSKVQRQSWEELLGKVKALASQRHVLLKEYQKIEQAILT